MPRMDNQLLFIDHHSIRQYILFCARYKVIQKYVFCFTQV